MESAALAAKGTAGRNASQRTGLVRLGVPEVFGVKWSRRCWSACSTPIPTCRST